MPGNKDLPQPPMNPDDDLSAFDAAFGLAKPPRQDISAGSADLDPVMAARILQRFGKIPEFGKWGDGFRMVENHALDPEDAWFRIESEKTGPIDYALIREEDYSIARRSRDVAIGNGIDIAYWSTNYQKTYTILMHHHRVTNAGVVVHYVEDSHEPFIGQTAPLVKLAYNFRPNQGIDPFMHISVPMGMREDVERRVQREGRLTTVYANAFVIVAEPSGMLIKRERENVVLPWDEWLTEDNSNVSFKLEQDDETVTLRKTRFSDARNESVTFLSPEAAVPLLLKGEAEKPAAGWKDFDRIFPVYFNDQPSRLSLKGLED